MKINSVLFVCLGNICRSPIGEGVLTHLTEQQGLGWKIDSAGTSAYHIGEKPDPGSIRICQSHGIDITGQRARQVKPQDFHDFDLILAMDESNFRNLRKMAPSDGKAGLYLLRDYDPQARQGDRSVPDPWGGGPDGFTVVYEMVERSLKNFLNVVERQ